MLSDSLAAEVKLALYFQRLAQGELSVELARQVLAKQYQFEPYTLFAYLSGPSKTRLTSYDLLKFAKANHVLIPEEEVFAIVRYYSSNRRGEMSYSDFLNMVLPSQNPILRSQATNRRSLRLTVEKELPVVVELGFCKVLQEEQRLQERMRDFRLDIARRSGYKIYQLFELVAGNWDRDIRADNIREFLQRHGIYANSQDLAFIIQRLDRDLDGRVSYMDLLDSLLPFEAPGFRREPRTEPRERLGREYRYASPQPRSEGRVQRPLSVSPEKESRSPASMRVRRAEDEFRPMQLEEAKRLQAKPREVGVQVPDHEEEKEAIIREPSEVPAEQKKEEEVAAPRGQQINPEEEKKETLPKGADEAVEPEPEPTVEESVTQGQKEVPKKLVPRELEEEPEQEVAYKTPERNVPESPEYPTTGETPAKPIEEKPKFAGEPKSLYKELEGNNKQAAESLSKIFREQITLDKEAEAARERVCLKIDYHTQDAFNFFDRKKNGSITLYELRIGLDKLKVRRNFEELLQLMKRYDLDANGSLSLSEFEGMLLPKKQYYADLLAKRVPKASPGEMVFSPETKLLFTSLLQSIIDTELTMEKLRRKVSESEDFHFEDAFGVCGPDSEGYIAARGIKDMLKNTMQFVSDTDLAILMSRYDKDRDDKISFSEFVRELTPSLAAL